MIDISYQLSGHAAYQLDQLCGLILSGRANLAPPTYCLL